MEFNIIIYQPEYDDLIELNNKANEMYKTLTSQPTESSGGSILKKKEA